MICRHLGLDPGPDLGPLQVSWIADLQKLAIREYNEEDEVDPEIQIVETGDFRVGIV